MVLRRDAVGIRDAALAAVDPGAMLRRHFVPPDGPFWVFGAGKAAGVMAAVVEELHGDRVAGGLVVVPEGGQRPLQWIELLVAAHPIPDRRSVAAGRRMLAEVAARSPLEQIVGLWSGGASALLEVPVRGLDVQAIAAQTDLALRCGVEIRELNELRRSWSAIKGGKLAEAGPAPWRNYVLSDVPGDDPALVGSGPAIRDGDGTVVVGSNAIALEAARLEAAHRKYATLVLDPALRGEARDAGERVADAIRALPETGRPPLALLLGGEPVVTGVPPGVAGGRMQELALAAALGIEGLAAVVLATSTDGRDGTTDAAGAIVDGGTVGWARSLGLDPLAALVRHESHRVLAATNDLLITGPTGTNVRDLVIALIGPS